ncbi:MAG: GNAT family N-acetyltransferase [Planctomycetota bacterium]
MPEIRSSTTDPDAAHHAIRVDARRGSVIVEHATPRDVDGIAALLQDFSGKGFVLFRRPSEVRAHLDSFVVVRDTGGWVTACGAYERVLPTLGEIRSIAVSDYETGRGAGRYVVERLIAEARIDGCRQLALLTRIPSFFVRCGFEDRTVETMPTEFIQKVVLDRGRSLEGRTPMLLDLD